MRRVLSFSATYLCCACLCRSRKEDSQHRLKSAARPRAKGFSSKQLGANDMNCTLTLEHLGLSVDRLNRARCASGSAKNKAHRSQRLVHTGGALSDTFGRPQGHGPDGNQFTGFRRLGGSAPCNWIPSSPPLDGTATKPLTGAINWPPFSGHQRVTVPGATASDKSAAAPRGQDAP